MEKGKRTAMEIEVEEIHFNKRTLDIQDFIELLSDDELKRIHSDLLNYCQCGNSKENEDLVCEECL